MTRRLLPLALLAGWLGTTGCYAMDIDATALEPTVYLNYDATDAPETIGEFEAETEASWLWWGLVELDEPEVADAIMRAVQRRGGTAATGVEITTKMTFMDGFLSTLTLGIYGRRTTVVTGTVVR